MARSARCPHAAFPSGCPAHQAALWLSDVAPSSRSRGWLRLIPGAAPPRRKWIMAVTAEPRAVAEKHP